MVTTGVGVLAAAIYGERPGMWLASCHAQDRLPNKESSSPDVSGDSVEEPCLKHMPRLLVWNALTLPP
jgi:hypothetical protein